MKVKVSIIIPAFNVSNYIGETINSALNQNFGEYEVIVVNDGSKDDTGVICDNYASENDNLMVIHQENGGVMAARLNGVNHCHGDWVTFLDGDDLLPIDAITALYSHISSDVDVVLGRIECIDMSGRVKRVETIKKTGIIDGAHYERIISKTPKALHGILYRKSILGDISIDRKIVNNEDQIFNIFLTNRIRKAFISKEIVHKYRIRQDSVSKQYYSADYWYMMVSYVRENYKKYKVKDIIYRRYILTRICSISRSLVDIQLDLFNPVFDHLRELNFSPQYGLYANIAIAILKYPNGCFMKAMQLHPRLFLSNFLNKK